MKPAEHPWLHDGRRDLQVLFLFGHRFCVARVAADGVLGAAVPVQRVLRLEVVAHRAGFPTEPQLRQMGCFRLGLGLNPSLLLPLCESVPGHLASHRSLQRHARAFSQQTRVHVSDVSQRFERSSRDSRFFLDLLLLARAFFARLCLVLAQPLRTLLLLLGALHLCCSLVCAWRCLDLTFCCCESEPTTTGQFLSRRFHAPRNTERQGGLEHLQVQIHSARDVHGGETRVVSENLLERSVEFDKARVALPLHETVLHRVGQDVLFGRCITHLVQLRKRSWAAGRQRQRASLRRLIRLDRGGSLDFHGSRQSATGLQSMARRREAWVVPRWSPQLKHDSDSTFAGGISRILGLDRHSKAQDFLPAKWVDADGLGPRPCGAAASLTVPLCVDRQVGHAHFNAVAVEPGLASIALDHLAIATSLVKTRLRAEQCLRCR
mmetsp:Transcript_50145/g.118112  ORF Transcript_50145/g.118112 Transcript_50145/m.118112 type:complete len:435 (-) Transcript_50145:47-1351(-)